MTIMAILNILIFTETVFLIFPTGKSVHYFKHTAAGDKT